MILDDVIEKKKSCLFEIYTFFCVFWMDILTFTNGIGFLMLFKVIAEKRPRRFNSIPSEKSSTSHHSITDLVDKWKRKDYGTGSIKQLLQAKSGHYSSLSSFSSKQTD